MTQAGVLCPDTTTQDIHMVVLWGTGLCTMSSRMADAVLHQYKRYDQDKTLGTVETPAFIALNWG